MTVESACIHMYLYCVHCSARQIQKIADELDEVGISRIH